MADARVMCPNLPECAHMPESALHERAKRRRGTNPIWAANVEGAPAV